MSAPEDDLRAAVERAGWGPEFELHSIGASGNNRVVRFVSDGGSFLLKRYFQHPDDPRDRFAAERAFYSLLETAGVRRTPQPLRWHAGERLALFEFIEGVRPSLATAALVEEAAHFFSELNASRFVPESATLPLASESCFSFAAHLATVERRVARLAAVESDRAAADFIARELTPAWRELHAQLAGSQLGQALDRPLDSEARCLSPSDFGFHNTLHTAGGALRFFDFEYAGWDDPAKTVCDFFCQPAVPVPITFLDDFCRGFASFDAPGFRERVALLLPVYRLKWCCIMLNDFLPADGRRRQFSDPLGDHRARREAQLAKARLALAELHL